jgi:hypothetical protein
MLLLFSFRTSSLDSLTGTMLSFICIYWWEQRGYSLPANWIRRWNFRKNFVFFCSHYSVRLLQAWIQFSAN